MSADLHTTTTAIPLSAPPQFYAFRWITLLLSQEFPLQDILRIWDTILSDPAGRADSLLRICCAMILYLRAILMKVRGCLYMCG